MFTPKKPTHRIKAHVRGKKAYTVVGSCWLNEDGSISIEIHPGCVLRWDDGLELTAFPDDGPVKEKSA